LNVLQVNAVSATDAWQLEDEAISKFNDGAYDGAIELFYRTTSMAPNDASLHFNFALALAKLGENIVALNVLKKGLEIDGHDKQALRLLSILFADVRTSDQSLRNMAGIEWIGHYLKIKDLFLNYLDSGNPDVDLILSSADDDLHENDWQSLDVVDQDKKVSSNLKNHVLQDFQPIPLESCYKYISLPCLAGNKVDDIMGYIVSNYDDLLETDRSVALIWVFGKGKKKYENADYEDAVSIFEALATVEPTNIAVLFYCSKTLRDSGDMDMILRSTEYLKRIIQLNPENALAWYEISLSYAIIGDLQKELFCLQRAFDLGHSKQDIERIMYLESIAAPVDPFSS